MGDNAQPLGAMVVARWSAHPKAPGVRWAASTAGAIRDVIVVGDVDHATRAAFVRLKGKREADLAQGGATGPSAVRCAAEVLATLIYVVGILAIFVLGTAGLLLLGPPGDEQHLTTAITACAATLNNIGPGLAAVGPTHAFHDFSPAAKLLMTLLMAVGRLEMFPLLALTMPRFWRSE